MYKGCKGDVLNFGGFGDSLEVLSWGIELRRFRGIRRLGVVAGVMIGRECRGHRGESFGYVFRGLGGIFVEIEGVLELLF